MLIYSPFVDVVEVGKNVSDVAVDVVGGLDEICSRDVEEITAVEKSEITLLFECQR